MMKLRTAGDHTHTIERHFPSGMYEIRIRSGVTLIAKHLFDSGREAHRAFQLSAETFIERYN